MNLYNKICYVTIILMLILSIGKVHASADFDLYEYNCPVEPGEKNKSTKKAPPYDYGDRTQLSAFLLCLLLGFTGAHHFYMKHYLMGSIQLLLFLFSITLSSFGIGLFAAWLFLIALFGWLIVDSLLIILGGLRLRNRKKLIPFEHQF